MQPGIQSGPRSLSCKRLERAVHKPGTEVVSDYRPFIAIRGFRPAVGVPASLATIQLFSLSGLEPLPAPLADQFHHFCFHHANQSLVVVADLVAWPDE